MDFKILLVEDNPADVHLTKYALNKAEVENEMFVAGDGEEAEEFLSKSGSFVNAPTPDLIILDLNLPKKTGFDVLDSIKKDPTLRSVPVIILTTSGNKSDIVKSYNGYANSYIRKPSEIDEFFEAMKCVKRYWVNTVQLPTLKAS